MSPRAYRSTARRTAADQTRSRIVEAARELLASPAGGGFSVEAVARAAGVVRMTVYYQFGSKGGLLEALFDHLAQRGRIERLRDVSQMPNPLAALDAFIGMFADFYDTDRVVIRRLNALAGLDPEVAHSLGKRVAWRRHGAHALLGRIAVGHAALAVDLDEAADVLMMLTSFETFDQLAGSRAIADIAPTVQRLVRAGLLAPS